VGEGNKGRSVEPVTWLGARVWQVTLAIKKIVLKSPSVRAWCWFVTPRIARGRFCGSRPARGTLSPPSFTERTSNTKVRRCQVVHASRVDESGQ